MFHTATVRPKRLGPRILYNTSLNGVNSIQFEKSLYWKQLVDFLCTLANQIFLERFFSEVSQIFRSFLIREQKKFFKKFGPLGYFPSPT